MAAVKGTTTVDFGSTPTDYGDFTVVDAALNGLTYTEAFFQASDTTTDNDATSHETMAALSRCVCAAPVGNNMSVRVFIERGLVIGTFKLRYVGA